jgi:hypothetical protein
MGRTVMQKTNGDGFPKPREIIEITRTHDLEAMDRAILDLLYRHAHDSGRLVDPLAEFEIEMARLRPSKHESNDRVREALHRLKRVEVAVSYVKTDTGEPRVLLTNLFDFFDYPVNGAPTAILRFGLPRKLQPIIARSECWGRIKAEVVCAMTSKYAIALYGLIRLRANRRNIAETFPIDRFRDLMGVPPGKLLRGNHLVERVLDIAALEVNKLSEVNVELRAERASPRAPITAVTVTWRRKTLAEQLEVERELKASKVGRMARLRGDVERVTE